MSDVQDENVFADGEVSHPLPAAEPIAAQVVKFCRVCGTPWLPEWIECPTCAARPSASRLAQEADTTYQQHRQRVKSAIGLYFSLLAVSAITLVVVLIHGNERSVATEIFASVLMSVIIAGWSIRDRHEILPLLRRVPNVLWLLVGALLGVPTFLIASGAVSALVHLFDIPQIDYLPGIFEAGYGWGLAIVLICVQPAVFEELAFRGGVLSALEPVIGMHEAVIVSALMFAILHLSLLSIPHLFLLGVTLAWLKQRTGSLYAGMFTHFSHNLLVLLSERYQEWMPW